MAALQSNAQLGNSIWGNSSNTITIGEPLYDARNWGRPPSEQALNSLRGISNGGSQNSSNQRRRFRDASGNLILTDGQGSIVYDTQGLPIIDSTGGQGQANGSINADADGGPPPPPDDPIDVPIDGGVGILLAIGLVIGYKQSGIKKGLPKKLHNNKIPVNN